MSRSNGPIGQGRGNPPQWPPAAEHDPAVQQALAAAQAAARTAQARQPGPTFGNVQPAQTGYPPQQPFQPSGYPPQPTHQ